MKKIKYLVFSVLLVSILVLGGELYQSYLRGIGGSFCSFVADGHKSCKSVALEAEKVRIGVFAYQTKDENADSTILEIYASERMQESFSQKYGIYSGRFAGFLSGMTEVRIHPITEIPKDSIIDIFYFDGNAEDTIRVRDGGNFGVPVHKGEPSILPTLLVAAFSVSMTLLLLFTWMDIQFQKKKNFIQISMGYSVWSVILKNVLLDMGVLVAAFFGVSFLASRVFYIGFQWKVLSICFVCAMLINGCLYLVNLKIDYKKALRGSDIDGDLLSGCYAMKVISMLLAVGTVAVSIGVLGRNSNLLGAYEAIEASVNARFAEMYVDTADTESYLAEIEKRSRVSSEVVLDAMRQDKVILSCGDLSLEENGLSVFHVNHRAYGIEGIKEQAREEVAEMILFIPQRLSRYKAIAGHEAEILEMALGSSKSIKNIAVRYYEGGLEAVRFFGQFDENDGQADSENKERFAVEEYPILVYWNHVPTDSDVYYSCFSGAVLENILFDMDDAEIRALTDRFEGLKVEYTISAGERYSTRKTRLVREATLSIALALVILLWEMMNLAVVVKLEYTVNARELALKKVFGYSVLQRYKGIWLTNLYASAIGTTTVSVIWLMLRRSGILTVYLSIFAILLLESLFTLLYIRKTERGSIVKTLKGGCL